MANSEIRDAGQEGTKPFDWTNGEKWMQAAILELASLNTSDPRLIAKVLARHVPVSAPVNTCPTCRSLKREHRNGPTNTANPQFWKKTGESTYECSDPWHVNHVNEEFAEEVAQELHDQFIIQGKQPEEMHGWIIGAIKAYRMAPVPERTNEDQIKHMVNRFLTWRLPENFRPDAGISFRPNFNEHTSHPMKHEPVGTNLFDYTQAEEMIRYMVNGIPSVLAAPVPQTETKHKYAGWPGKALCGEVGGICTIANVEVNCPACKSALAAPVPEPEPSLQFMNETKLANIERGGEAVNFEDNPAEFVQAARERKKARLLAEIVPEPEPAKTCPTCGSDNPKRAYCCINNKCGICSDAWHRYVEPPARKDEPGTLTRFACLCGEQFQVEGKVIGRLLWQSPLAPSAKVPPVAPQASPEKK